MLLLVDCGSVHTPKIEEILEQLGMKHEVKKPKNLLSEDIDKYSKVIISGSPKLLSEEDLEEYLEPFQFLKNWDKPVLGICFGHQILSALFGGEVKNGEEIQDTIDIRFLSDSRLFHGLEQTTTMAQDHEERVTLPDNFQHLGTSEDAEVEAMKHVEKDIYGVQFHPEVSGESGKKVIKNFCDT